MVNLLVDFNKESPIIYVLVGLIIALVMGQAVFFMLKALKRAKELGVKSEQIRKTVVNSIIFTIAPAVAILISVAVLSHDLGLALPWLRLSVVGSQTYETTAANNTLVGIFGKGYGLGNLPAPLNASQYVTVIFVMTISITAGIIFAPMVSKKLHNGLMTLEKRDKAWSEIFSNSMFVGMLAAFLGYIFGDFTNVFTGDTTVLIPGLVFAASALIMLICGALMKITKQRWISDYALPISMVLGMALAIPITAWLG